MDIPYGAYEQGRSICCQPSNILHNLSKNMQKREKTEPKTSPFIKIKDFLIELVRLSVGTLVHK